MKIYSLGVTIYATAYIKASSEEEARQLVQDELLGNWIEVAEDELFCGKPYHDLFEDGPEVSLSPAMTPDHISTDYIEVAYDPDEDNDE